MNLAHLHLNLKHLPVIGTLLALLLMVAAVVRHSDELKRLSLLALVLLGLVAIPVYLTGEPAAGLLERMPGVAKAAIETHEDSAALALIAMEVLGALALVGLVFFRRAPQMPRWFFTVSLLLAIVVAGLMARTANLGGLIRHSEVTGSAPASATQPDD